MSIDARCKEQRPVADRMFMDFKYTRPGSKEQLRLEHAELSHRDVGRFPRDRREEDGSGFGPKSRSFLGTAQPLPSLFHGKED